MDSMVTEAMKHFYASVQLTRGLLFANDVVTMAESEKALQHNLQRFIMYVCMQYGCIRLSLFISLHAYIQGSLPHGGITRSE